MSAQKHPMSIYTVMLILSMIFMLLALILISIEYFRWRDTAPSAQAAQQFISGYLQS